MRVSAVESAMVDLLRLPIEQWHLDGLIDPYTDDIDNIHENRLQAARNASHACISRNTSVRRWRKCPGGCVSLKRPANKKI